MVVESLELPEAKIILTIAYLLTTGGAGGEEQASPHWPSTPILLDLSSTMRRREETLGISRSVVESESAPLPPAGKTKVGRFAGPSLSQSSEHVFSQ